MTTRRSILKAAAAMLGIGTVAELHRRYDVRWPTKAAAPTNEFILSGLRESEFSTGETCPSYDLGEPVKALIPIEGTGDMLIVGEHGRVVKVKADGSAWLRKRDEDTGGWDYSEPFTC